MLSMEKAKWLKLHGQSNMSTGDPPYSVQGLSQNWHQCSLQTEQTEIKLWPGNVVRMQANVYSWKAL